MKVHHSITCVLTWLSARRCASIRSGLSQLSNLGSVYQSSLLRMKNGLGQPSFPEHLCVIFKVEVSKTRTCYGPHHSPLQICRLVYIARNKCSNLLCCNSLKLFCYHRVLPYAWNLVNVLFIDTAVCLVYLARHGQ